MLKITDNTKELAKRMKGRGNYAEDLVKKIITKATFIVEGTVKEGIEGGPASGGSVIRYHDGAKVTHRVSAAGEYPATDTGFLVTHVSAKVSLVELEGVVTSSAPYSKDLEYGTTNMQARPFMFPSLEKNKPRIRRMFKDAGLVKKVKN